MRAAPEKFKALLDDCSGKRRIAPLPDHDDFILRTLRDDPALSQILSGKKTIISQLHSLAGCSVQSFSENPFHNDYVAPHSGKSGSLLVAQQAGTQWRFTLDDPPHTTHTQYRTIELNAGDAVYFRSDCWHSGGAYSRSNHRVFLFIFTTEHKPQTDSVFVPR